MKQDVNKIIDLISEDWAKEVATLRKRVAILMEENSRLKAEIEQKSEGDE